MSQHETQRIYLGLGSNTNARANLRSCLRWLRHSFLHTTVSPAYRSPAFGFEGNDFINLVVAIDSAIAPQALKSWLRQLEDAHGRDRSQPRFSDRTLDVDILLFGDQVMPQWQIPRNETFTQPYILKPLWDLAPQLRDPRTGQTVDALWRAMHGSGHAPIEPVVLEQQ
jgi:2-amino-4-hydroxy-6-hydroxymethyldihydropteridine diphosphokinase